MTKPFSLDVWLADKNQTVKTADNHNARIVATDVKTSYGRPDRILALVTSSSGYDHALFYNKDGKCLSDSGHKGLKDLVLTDNQTIELNQFEYTMLRYLQDGANAKDDDEILNITKKYSSELMHSLNEKTITRQGEIVKDINNNLKVVAPLKDQNELFKFGETVLVTITKN